MGESDSPRPEPAADQALPAGRQEKLPVCLVEYNPLAARRLHQLLETDPALELLPYDDLFRSKRSPKLLAPVFVLDRGTLPMPLSKFLRVVRVRFRHAKTIILDDPMPRPELFRLLFLGIQGFLPYQEVEKRLLEAIRAVSEGRLWLAPEVLEQYLRYTSQFSHAKATRLQTLTGRERRIIELVQRRLSNKEISSILGISEGTVKFHLSNVFAKLGVSDRHEVVELVSSQPPGKLLPQKSK